MTTWPAHQASLTDLFCLRFGALPAHAAPAKPQKHFPDLTVKEPDTGTIHKILQPQTVSQSRAASRILHGLRGSSTFVYFGTGHMRKLHGSSPQLRPAVRDQLLELSTSIGQLTKEWVFCDTTLQGGCIHIALGPLSFGCRHQSEFSRQRISGCSACRDVRALRRLFQSRHSPLLPTALEDRASSLFIGIALVLVASVLSWSCLSVPPLCSPERLRTAARWRQCRTSLTRTDDDGGLMMQTRGQTSFGLAQLSWSQAQAALQNSAPGHSRCTGTAALAALGFPASPTARFLHLKRTRVARGTGWPRAPSGQRQDDVAALSSNTAANVQESQIGPALWSRLGWGLQFSPAPHGSV